MRIVSWGLLHCGIDTILGWTPYMGFSSASSNSAELDKHRDLLLHSTISRLCGQCTINRVVRKVCRYPVRATWEIALCE